MNGVDSKGGPRVLKPLESDAARPRPARPAAAEKRTPAQPVNVVFSGTDADLHKQLAALQAHMAELRTARAVSRACLGP